MRTNVSFRYPAPCSDHEEIFSVDGAQWFIEILQAIPGIQIDNNLCQEDWGVVVFVQRNDARFWIGIGYRDEEEWLAFCKPTAASWLPWRRRDYRREFGNLVEAMHDVLKNDASVSEIVWYEEPAMRTPNPKGFATPV